jgi:5-hydroxyisourate hydrolase-like protein (transthyretin family)
MDSDANPADGCTDVITLASGATDLSIDLGLKPVAGTDPVGGNLITHVWNDANSNGLRDNAEAGVANVLSWVFDQNWNWIAEGMTDSNGVLQYSDLTPGSYYLCFDTTTFPVNHTITTANAGDDSIDSDVMADGCTEIIVLTATADQTRDLGLIAAVNNDTAMIGDYVWMDTDFDGIQTAGERGVANISVWLFDENWNWVNETMTDASGRYNLETQPGTYYICVDFSGVANAIPALQNQGSDTGLDSDAFADGCTGAITVVAGQHDMSVDIGLIEDIK